MARIPVETTRKYLNSLMMGSALACAVSVAPVFPLLATNSAVAQEIEDNVSDEAQGEAENHDPYVRAERKVGRNEPCPCGSGKKFKHCHGKLN